MTTSTAQPKEHRRIVWKDFKAFCDMLAGDPVLVPFKDGAPDWEATTRDSIEKIAHWSDFEISDIPRLAVLTDGFGRFIGEGDDVSIVTAWREGTPIIQQIDGEPCERAADLIREAIASDLCIEDMLGLPFAEETDAPAAAPSKVRAELDALADRFEKRTAANDNKPQFDDRLLPYGDAFGGQIIGNTLYSATVDGTHGQIHFSADGNAWFYTAKGARRIDLPTKPKRLAASPFRLKDPTSIPEREWLFAKHYIRRYLSITVGAGGGGKSAHAVSEALAMAAGRPLLDPSGPLSKPLRTWYINAEDPQDEIDRRFVAAAKHFDVTEEQIADRLFTDSGRDQEFVILRQEGRDFKVCEPMVADMLATIRENNIDTIIVDPFVSTHEVPENDNNLIQRVAKAWRRVADEGNCSVELIHHVTKGNIEVTADSARGGGALKDAARSVRTINPMTKEEAEKAGVEDPRGYFRVDFGKFNMVAAGSSQWRRFVSVPLMNGRGLVKSGDEIGVVESWRWPASADAVADVTPEELEAIKRKIGGTDCRDSVQSPQWAGYRVAEALRINVADTAEKKRVGRMLDAWKRQGHFSIEMRPDHKGNDRPCLVPIFHTSEN